jgi:hypothetical protein
MSRNPSACRWPNWSLCSSCWAGTKADPQREHARRGGEATSLKANELTEKVVTVAQHVQTGLPCWGSELIPAEDREHHRQKLDD